MDYTSYKDIKYYKECSALVEGLGFKLVDLKIIPAKTITKITAMIASPDPKESIGVNDCAKVHRALLPRLEALLGTEDTTMELTSPGIEHNIKNAAEFALFVNLFVRVWDTEVTDWVPGKIIEATNASLTLELESGEKKQIEYNRIAKAKLLNT